MHACTHICMHKRECACIWWGQHMAHMGRSEDNLQKSFLPSPTWIWLSGSVASAFMWCTILLVGTYSFHCGLPAGLASDLTEKIRAQGFAKLTLLGVAGHFLVLVAMHSPNAQLPFGLGPTICLEWAEGVSQEGGLTRGGSVMCGAGLFCVLSSLKLPREAVLTGWTEGPVMGAQCGYQLLLQTHRPAGLTHGVHTCENTHE